MKSFFIKQQNTYLINEDLLIDQIDFVERKDRLRIKDIGSQGSRAHFLKKLPKFYLNFILKQNKIASFFNNHQNNTEISLHKLILLNRLDVYLKYGKNKFINKQKKLFLNSNFINKLKKKNPDTLEQKKAQSAVILISKYIKKKKFFSNK